ncbi:co-chaperone GroES [Sulfurospirillum sp. 1612]|uniref:co-chaperone GroES n=1 Tax=Sulfurospirillum sp. 1612 TaxID=3094835 RepID=UPI002F94834D
MTFKPLGERVLLQRIEEPKKTATGIIIPDNAKEKPLSAEVISISKEIEDEGIIKVGDKVIFAKYAGTELNLDGKEYLVMNKDDILGIL